MESAIAPLAHNVLEAYTATSDATDALTRVVSLHVCLKVDQLDLTKVIGILRPIARIHRELETISPMIESTIKSVSVMSPDHSSKFVKMPPTLTTFIVDTLFTSIRTSCVGIVPLASESKSGNLTLWYKSYRDIVSLDLLWDILYPVVEVKLFIYLDPIDVYACSCGRYTRKSYSTS